MCQLLTLDIDNLHLNLLGTRHQPPVLHHSTGGSGPAVQQVLHRRLVSDPRHRLAYVNCSPPTPLVVEVSLTSDRRENPR